MTQEEFSGQMSRLIATYGAPTYSAERLKLIAAEVQDFEVTWLKGVVDYLIGSQRQAPLVDAFAAAATAERERQWSAEREVEKVAAKKFFSGRTQYSDADVALRFQMIRDLMNPDLSAESRASILAYFGPSDLNLDGHAALSDPKTSVPREVAIDPELAERQRRSLPYIDN